MTNNQTATVAAAVAAALAKPARVPSVRVNTDEDIRALGTRAKGYKAFTDIVPNLHVFVTPKGAKSFRLNYQTHDGVYKTHTFGKFGPLTLAQAVGMYEAAREQLGRGDCPRAAQLKARANKFATVADEFAAWFPRYRCDVSPEYAQRTESLFKSAEFGAFRTRRLASIEAAEVLTFARAVEVSRSNGYAREVVHLVDKLYRNARLHGRHKGDNPANGVVENLRRRDSQPFRALSLRELPVYFADLASLKTRNAAKAQTLLALTILPYITVRPSVLRFAQWSWISWDGEHGAMLTVPAFVPGTKQRVTEQRADKRGKAYADYRVPLSRQVVDLLRQLQALTGEGRYLFPGYKGRGHTNERPISEGRWLSRIRGMGWDGTGERAAITVHGFRGLFATAATTRYCVIEADTHALEFQQDHKLTEGVRANYTHDDEGSHRGLLLPERVKLMQWWANEVDAVLAHKGPGLPVSRTARAAALVAREFDI